MVEIKPYRGVDKMSIPAILGDMLGDLVLRRSEVETHTKTVRKLRRQELWHSAKTVFTRHRK